MPLPLGLITLKHMLLLTKNKRSSMRLLLITAMLVIIHLALRIAMRVFQLYMRCIKFCHLNKITHINCVICKLKKPIPSYLLRMSTVSDL